MWHLLKKILLFLCLFFLLNTLLVCLCGDLLPKSVTKPFLRYRRCGGGHLFTRLDEARKTKGVDILFLGTSHAYRGFDTRIFADSGYRSFNFGSSIQTALQTELLMEKYLDSIRPKQVIFDVNPAIFGNDGSESAADIISNDHVDWRTVKMALEVNSYKVYNTLLYAAYRQATGRGGELKESPYYLHDRYITGGYVETKLSRNLPNNEPFTPVAYQFYDHQMEAFDNILRMLKARKIPYVLVQSPITKAAFASKTNNRYVDSLIAAKGRYYNFNLRLAMDDTYDFFDDDHLSQRGVEKFNAALIATLKADGFLAPQNLTVKSNH